MLCLVFVLAKLACRQSDEQIDRQTNERNMNRQMEKPSWKTERYKRKTFKLKEIDIQTDRYNKRENDKYNEGYRDRKI
jgi:hypothetical protein